MCTNDHRLFYLITREVGKSNYMGWRASADQRQTLLSSYEQLWLYEYSMMKLMGDLFIFGSSFSSIFISSLTFAKLEILSTIFMVVL